MNQLQARKREQDSLHREYLIGLIQASMAAGLAQYRCPSGNAVLRAA